jgi:hypothetical protein
MKKKIMLGILAVLMLVCIVPNVFSAVNCSGGTITTSGAYTIHTFITNGTFNTLSCGITNV